ncbi:MAG: AarF/UbiB family protein [Dehalococcoidia bacterium]|nr:AarF/UbiB family protein [Dehalococcoidia bacterium]
MGGSLRGGRLRRSLRPLGLGMRSAARWAASVPGSKVGRQRRSREASRRTGEDITRTMGEMKGAAMKLGQVMSMMSGVVPEEMSESLSTLQASAPPMDYELVAGVLEEELGAPPEEVFASFEREPFAAASLGQVHRATLHDGRDVAVKVQYPGVAEAIDHDLSNIGMLVTMGGMFSRGLDAESDPCVTSRAESAGNWTTSGRRGTSSDSPTCTRGTRSSGYRRWCRNCAGRGCSCRSTSQGRPFSGCGALTARRSGTGIAEIVYRFAFGSLYQHLLFNGDPQPGNYLLLEDGSVAFVDYGCVAEFSDDVLEGFRRIVRALIEDDRTEWREAVEDIGILSRDAPFDTETLYEHMHWYWAPILGER